MSMMIFFLVFFGVYGGAHLYVFLKVKKAFLPGLSLSIPIAAFMLLMVIAPIIIYWAERLGAEALARAMSYAGYIWMGLLFFFICASFTMDILKLLHGGRPSFSAKISFYIPLVISIVAALYGYFEAKGIRTERLTVKTAKLPAGIERLRVVQISDVHIGLIVKGERLKRILDAVRKAEPDMLVSTGDLVDGQINSLSECVGPFKEINPRFGKFAITGNHEFYAGLPQALAFTERASFRILRAETVSGVINIAGLDDRQGKTYGFYKGNGEKEMLGGLPRDRFTLLLKHRPLVEKDSVGLFDLQLSGHAHKGQIFPFSIPVGLVYKYLSGYYELGNDSSVYVSRGTGTWGPPMRLFSPPEVTIIDIESSRLSSHLKR